MPREAETNLPHTRRQAYIALDVTTINTKADNSVYVDRRHMTGASPQAANDFGRLSAPTQTVEAKVAHRD